MSGIIGHEPFGKSGVISGGAYFNGNVGIGTTTTTGKKLAVENDSTTSVSSTYGSHTTLNITAGTVTNAYGAYISANSSSSPTISDSLIGIGVAVDVATAPASVARAMNMVMSGSALATDDFFIQGYDAKNSNVAFKILSTGNATFDSGDFDGSPDYAEYFESKSGSTIPVGSTVKLDGNKIVICAEGDTPIGVIRPKNSSAVVAGSASLKWAGKYLTDDYDQLLYEDYTYTKWEVEIDFAEYSSSDIPEEERCLYSKVEGDPDRYYRRHSYDSDRIPAGLTVPDDAEVVVPKSQRRKLNPDFDESIEYSPRKERDEWCLVGLLGQIPITKGQPTATNWIKMNDVSETVEMWFVK